MSQPRHPINPSSWLSPLRDDLSISEINLPGSHNAAAINTDKPTRWACQRHSITDQLQKGIRLLDIRLKPKKRNDTYEFITCHGHLGPFGKNEFQPLEKVLEACTCFLQTSPRETIILMIKIDDWHRAPRQTHPKILNTLQTQLTRLPLLLTSNMPTLKECRGRIFLINRINDDPTLGVPINIPDNTPGTTLQPTATRNYDVYIQDQYKKLKRKNPEAHKLQLTIAAAEKKPKATLLLNFASGTKPIGRFVYINEDLLQYFTQPPPLHASPGPAGWLLLDYPFGTSPQIALDLPKLIIASNYH